MRKGWEIKKLGDILQKTETIDPTKNPEKEFIYIDVSSVDNEKFIITNTSTLKGKEAPSRARKLLKENDIIFATVRPTLKRIAIVPNELNGEVCSTGYFVLRASDLIHYKLLYFYLQTDEFISSMEKLQKGASYPAVTDGEVRQQLISFPKQLSEQEYIVSVLDEAFAAITQAKENLQRNLQNSKELFQSKLNKIFANKGEDWIEKKLGEWGTITSSKRIYKSEYVSEGIPFYRTKEIKELSNEKEISLELFISKERYNEIKKSFGVPQVGDILMSAVGTIGEILVIENDDEFYFKDGNIVWLKKFNKVDPYYLKYALTAFVEVIKKLSIGSAYNALTIEKLNEHKVSIPSIDEQKKIVYQLDNLSDQTKNLENIYQQKLDNLEELKKSILQKAFSGELIIKQRAVA